MRLISMIDCLIIEFDRIARIKSERKHEKLLFHFFAASPEKCSNKNKKRIAKG